MLRLYGSAKSRALRNLWLLGELDVPYDHKDYLPGSPETRTDRIDRQIGNYFMHAKVLPEADRKPEIAQACWKEAVEAFEVLETALGKAAWLAGPSFSIADLNVAGALYRALFLDLSKWAHLQTWLTQCWARPAAKRVRAMRE